MTILLISNMYPSPEFPFLGTFVKNCESVLIDNAFTIDRVVINKKSKNVFDKLNNYLKFYILILSKLFLGNYNYVYAHYVSHVSIPLLIYGFFYKRTRIVIHVHGGDIKKLDGTSSTFFRIKFFLSKLILKRAYKVIVPSQAYKTFINANFTLNTDVVVYPSGGVDCNIFYPSSTKEKFEYKLGYAGRLVSSKNVHLVLEALAKTEHFTLDIIGEGPELSNLENLSKILNIENRVKFKKAKSQSELAKWYRNIDCLIYPSESESLGLVPIEALACGASVILSKIPAFQELQSNGFDINLMDSFSSDSICQKLDLVPDYDYYKREHNIDLVKRLYARSKVQEILINVFK